LRALRFAPKRRDRDKHIDGESRLQSRKYIDKDGIERDATDIIAENMMCSCASFVLSKPRSTMGDQG
jgi:hypothetical protein